MPKQYFLMKRLLKRLLPRLVQKKIRELIPSQRNNFLKKLNFKKLDNILYLGTDYGGWSFVNYKSLNNNYVLSAGLGEDASFDLELIRKYNCKVISIDPTPRAIDHYNMIINNSGKSKKKGYNETGKLDVSSYDLSKINNTNFILINQALYNINNIELKFFSPPNKNHVSYSINNWQNNYSNNTDFIKVKTTTIKSILQKFNINTLELIKLDIEGAEIEVIKNMINDQIYPKQILVEFDELINLKKISVDRFYEIHNILISKNYKLIKSLNNFPNFLYVLF